MKLRARSWMIACTFACALAVRADEPAGAALPVPDAATGAAAIPSADAAATAAKAPSTTPASQGAPARGAGALQLEATQITGNRELPKVMVIVPWKSAEPAQLAGRPINSLVEEVLTPIDRDVMRRTLDYYRLLAPDATSADAEQAADIDTTDQ